MDDDTRKIEATITVPEGSTFSAVDLGFAVASKLQAELEATREKLGEFSFSVVSYQARVSPEGEPFSMSQINTIDQALFVLEGVFNLKPHELPDLSPEVWLRAIEDVRNTINRWKAL